MPASSHADHAADLGLEIVPVDDLSIMREPVKDGFTYPPATGQPQLSETRKAQIEALVIPPNWQDVRIAPNENWHIQAVGRDAAGRLQYRYHDDWERVRNRVKAERLLIFGRALPALRERVKADLRKKIRSRDAVAATAIKLIDRKFVRSGHEQYVQDGTTGAATLSGRHVKTEGAETRLVYKGKSGREIDLEISDKQLRRRLRALKKRNRGRIFAWKSGGKKRGLGAQGINTYMRRVTGKPVSAKDFRTFGASAIAIAQLCEMEEDGDVSNRDRAVSTVMKDVAAKLHNTPTVARSSYVHPVIVSEFTNGALDPALIHGRMRDGLSREETALIRFLEAQLPAKKA